jgi:glycosyltransferase involved in cell wall biosynthesis
MKAPRISVVMSVYNGGVHLEAAIASILEQSYRDFEFIIINDGSTDSSEKIISSFKDPRIQLVQQENRGLVASLNRGIELAKGGYIARMDADDVSLSGRFAKQVEFLDENPTYVLVGGGLRFIDENSNPTIESPLLVGDAEIRLEMLVRCPFGHGSVMYRTAAMRQSGSYRQSYWPAEDYDAWSRLASSGKFANLNETVMLYRETAGGISKKNAAAQRSKTDAVRDNVWREAIHFVPQRGFSEHAASYADASKGGIQLSRLTGVYLSAILQAIGRGKLGIAARLCGQLFGDPRGLPRSLRYLGRKVIPA